MARDNLPERALYSGKKKRTFAFRKTRVGCTFASLFVRHCDLSIQEGDSSYGLCNSPEGAIGEDSSTI